MNQDQIYQLALAFFQQQDLSKLTPEQALDLFYGIYCSMSNHKVKKYPEPSRF